MVKINKLIKEFSDVTNFKLSIDNLRIKKSYEQIGDDLRVLKRGKDKTIAVVLHMYYTDLWPEFRTKLELLDSDTFDLFITIPLDKTDFINEIKAVFNNANIFFIPNRGRDVLPFLIICKGIIDKGYIKILKIHSKKSTHRKDGQEWLDGMLNTLLPDNRKQLDSIITKLDDPNTGIIGPYNQYISLPVNFDANSMHILKLIQEILNKKTSQEISSKRTDYGFFAGTMFWARMDTISSVINHNFNIRDFEAENGQIDSTLPHALERVFTLVAELEGKNIFESGPNGVRKLAYKTSNIPDWSDVYIGPK